MSAGPPSSTYLAAASGTRMSSYAGAGALYRMTRLTGVGRRARLGVKGPRPDLNEPGPLQLLGEERVDHLQHAPVHLRLQRLSRPVIVRVTVRLRHRDIHD